MKRILTNISIVALCSVISASCSKKKEESFSQTSSTSTTTTTTNQDDYFSLTYDGASFTGTSVNFVTHSSQDSDHTNTLTASAGNGWYIGVMNIPESGTQQLVGGTAYIANNGDCALTMTENGEMLMGGFGGSVTRISANKLQVNASRDGKSLTGTIEWQD